MMLTLFMVSIPFPSIAQEVAEAVEEESQLALFLGRFHPIVLHFPIGLLVAVFLLELAALFRTSRALEPAHWFLLILGTGSAIIASLFGWFLSWEGGYDEDTVFWHLWSGVGVAVFAVVAVGLKFRASRTMSEWSQWGYRITMLIVIGLLSVAGHFGGNLTHGSQYLFEHMPDYIPLSAQLKAMESGGPSAELVAGQYADVILPLFETQCYECHGDEKDKGDYKMQTREQLIAPGESKLPAIIPGDAAASNLVKLIALPEEHEFVMPPEGKGALSSEDILEIMHWIDRGADFGDGSNLIELEKPKNAPAELDLTGLSDDEPVDYEKYILPIFIASCWECHNDEVQDGDLRMDTLKHFLKGGEFGEIIEPGDVENSVLYELIILPEDDTDFMPAKNDPLPDYQIALIKRWIEEGCDFGDWTGEE
jgi:uncharacterized membrane protein